MKPEENKASSTSSYHETERKKSNLAFAFFCMDKERAKDMEIFYAFCRLMDDIADEEVATVDERRKSLDWWKEEIERACSNSVDESKLCPLGAEMRILIKRRNISKSDVLEIIDGVRRDTFSDSFDTLDDIKKYCHGVACAVGLVSICIFGCKSPKAKPFAEALGYALQFTNILRDVRDDLISHDRIYIPKSEMEEFGVTREMLLTPEASTEAKALFKMMWFRAKHYFNRAKRLLPEEDRRALAPALIMRNIYEKILDSLAELDFEIPAKPLKISKWKKISLALAAIRESKKTGLSDKFCGKAIVAGAGVAGTCAALKLAYEGFDVSLYEASSHPMGRASQIEWNGAKLDNGSHAVMGCYKNFFDYCRILNTDNESVFSPIKSLDFIEPNKNGLSKVITVKFPQKGIFSKAFSALTYLKIAGGIGNLSLLLSLKFGICKPDKNENALNFLTRKGVSKRDIQNFWQPFCISALNTKISETDARLLIRTLGKSSLKGGKSGEIIFPKKSIASVFWPRAKYFLEATGAKTAFSTSVKKLETSEGKISAVKTSDGLTEECDIVVCALPPKSLYKLFLESNIPATFDISNFSFRDILNIYFTTNRKLIKGNSACLTDSKLQWIFDHTGKIKNEESSKNSYLYGLTISAADFEENSSNTREMIESELERFFGKVEIDKFFAGRFSSATIGADSKTENARPDAKTFIPNLLLVGDWIHTGLPCTMESAAKSASDITKIL